MTINTCNYIYRDTAVQGKFTANTTQKYYLEWGLDDVLSVFTGYGLQLHKAITAQVVAVNCAN